MKKRILSLILVLAMCLGMMPAIAFAEGENVAYVTIAVEGDLKLVRYPVALTDVNENGQLDIDDALYLAHNNDDADQYGGYASSIHETYGRGVTKLWGDTSGWYGYTLNGATAGGADAVVEAGDELYAWVYTDKVYPNGNPDQVTFFDKTTASVAAGESVEVTLQPAAAITNGADVAVYKVKDTHRIGAEVETNAVFDAEGKATVTFSEAGTYVITAASQSDSPKAIVAPYCEVTVSESLASTDVMYTLGTVTGKPGDTVTVPITVATDYATSMNSLGFSVLMGDGLELVGATTGTVSDGWTILTGAGAIEMMGGGGAAFYMPSGQLLNLQIKINDDAQPGIYELDLGSFQYKSGSTVLSVVSTVTKGSITVEEAEEPAAATPFTVTVGETVMELVSKGNQSFGEGTNECETYEVTVPADTTSITVSSENKMYFYTPEGSGLGLGTSKTFNITEDTVYKINVSGVGYYYLSVKFESTAAEGLTDVILVAPEGLTTEDGVNYYGIETMSSYTFGFTTVPADIEVTQNWTFKDGGNNGTSGSGKEIRVSIWSAGTATLTLTVEDTNDDSNRITKTYYLHEAEEPEQPEEPEESAAPFTVTVGGEVMTEFTLGEVTDPYEGVKPLYTVTIPEDTTEVTITWNDGNKYTLSYYDANCSYFGFESGMQNSWTVTMDKNGDGAYDMLQIYDSGYGVPYWITFVSEEAEEEPVTAPFTVTVDGVEMTEFALSEVTDPYEGVKPLYTVTIPEDTTEVTITWNDGNKYTLSYYDANCSYFGFESGMQNSWTVTMDKNGDGAYDMLQIYDSGYGVPYWITFVSEEAEEEPVTAPFTVTVDGVEMTEFALSEVTDPYEGVKPLYTVTIPEGTTEVTITWNDGNSYTLSYYDANCNYFGFESGMKNSWTLPMDKNGDGAYDMLQIYDSGYGVPYWITFANAAAEEPEQPEMPFTITVNGEEMTKYTLSEVNDPDYGIKSLYTVTIPEGTTEATLSWNDGNNYTLSYYDSNCSLIGWEAGHKNSWTLPMDKNGDGAYDLIQVYDSSWGVPYWITFTSGTEEPEQPEEPNVVTVGNAEAWPGDLVEVSLYVQDATGFAPLFIPALSLPEGWTVAGATAGADLAGTVWEISETDYGWGLYGGSENQYGAYLPDGELMKFQIQVAADTEDGEYTIDLVSARMMKNLWEEAFSDFTLVDGTVTVTIPEGKIKLDAPVLTEDSVFAPETYIEITVPASAQEPAAVVEYAISTDGENWSEWQTDNRFTEVEDGAKYYVRARYTPHNAGFYEASDPSNVIEVITKAFVKDPVIFTFGDVIGSHGETIFVPITLSHSLDGMQQFGSFRFCIEVNENLTLVEVVDGNDLTDARFTNYDYPNHRAVSLNCSGNYAEVPEGEVMLLEIKVHEDAVPGTYKIGLDQVIEEVMLRYTVDGSGEYGTWIDYPLNVQVVEGTITIKEPLTAPVLTDYTATDDTITITAPEAVDGATIQYAISVDGKTYGEWQTDNVFAGLDEETAYYVIARYVVEEGHTNADSYASEPLEVKTVNPAAAYTLAEVSAKAGETVEVAVNLEHAIVKQATSFNLIPTATADVELTAAKAGKDLPEGWKVMLSDGVVTVYTTEATAIPTGEIVILTYQVGEETEDGDYTVTLTNAFTEDGNAFIAADNSILRVDGTVTAGKITVKNMIYGDINKDGIVDSKDLVSLRRYLAGWSAYTAETLDLTAADVNIDGAVSMTDAIILSRHLVAVADENSWQDYKTLPYAK